MRFVTITRILEGDTGGVQIKFMAALQKDHSPEYIGDPRYLMPYESWVNGVKLCYADTCTLWDATVCQDIALEELDDEEFEQKRMMEDNYGKC